jgi:hypothetical protein
MGFAVAWLWDIGKSASAFYVRVTRAWNRVPRAGQVYESAVSFTQFRYIFGGFMGLFSLVLVILGIASIVR